LLQRKGDSYLVKGDDLPVRNLKSCFVFTNQNMQSHENQKTTTNIADIAYAYLLHAGPVLSGISGKEGRRTGRKLLRQENAFRRC